MEVAQLDRNQLRAQLLLLPQEEPLHILTALAQLPAAAAVQEVLVDAGVLLGMVLTPVALAPVTHLAVAAVRACLAPEALAETAPQRQAATAASVREAAAAVRAIQQLALAATAAADSLASVGKLDNEKSFSGHSANAVLLFAWLGTANQRIIR